MVTDEFLARVRAATFAWLVRGSWPMLVGFAVLAIASLGMTLASGGGDWMWALAALVMGALVPYTLWRSASVAAGRLQRGSYLAYAVTPDGTFHCSSAAGTTTVNAGYVARLSAVRGFWIVVLHNGTTIPVPHELLPDAEARLLVRHLGGQLPAMPPA